MKTHNRFIYHCVRCGRISRVESEDSLPHCCGSEMVRAAAETVRESKQIDSEEAKQRVTNRQTSKSPSP